MFDLSVDMAAKENIPQNHHLLTWNLEVNSLKKFVKQIGENIWWIRYFLKYRGPILRVTSQALGSDDLTLDQSATSIQIILPEPAVTWQAFYKITIVTKDLL